MPPKISKLFKNTPIKKGTPLDAAGYDNPRENSETAQQDNSSDRNFSKIAKNTVSQGSNKYQRDAGHKR